MLIVLSPAKSLDFETRPTTKLTTTPDMLERSAALIDVLRNYSPGQLADLMKLSDPLAVLNVARYATWSPEPEDARQAIMAFNGDVYQGFDARSLKPKALAHAQAHVRILSGLYGVLRPFDLIHPHRLEMGTRLPTAGAKDLYGFWGDSVTDKLGEAIEANGAEVLVNLASEEYFKSVRPKLLPVPVVSPVFEDWKDGRYKIIPFYAKRARGMMARYAAEKGIVDAEKLKRFKVGGYAFSKRDSSESTWVFRRKLDA
ncbi:MAG: peroxide stress protein YaaA [Massilia sp.]|nr:peroxide stress protein YaaA [Massilia sp.]